MMTSNSSTFPILSDNPNICLNYYIHQFWRETGDHRTTNYPLVRDGPWFMLLIMACYLTFVNKIGPKLMKDRQPFDLRRPMLVYNCLMVVTNAYFFVQSLEWIKYGSALLDFKFPTKDDYSPAIERQIWTFYLYYCTKYMDLFDTVFFVLRKKYSQITVLHLYHHTAVPILGWLTFWYRFNVPSIILFAFLNSLVHVLMYSYYTLSAFGPRVQKYLWWKRYITQLQVLQFCIFGFYGTLVKLFHVGYPAVAFWTAYSQTLLFFYMFVHFYYRSYCKKSTKQSNKSD